MLHHVKRLGGGLAWWAYETAPAGADALFHLGRRYAMPLLRYAVPLARVRGRMLADGEPASLLVAGSGPQLLGLRHQFLTGELWTEALGACPAHALRRTLLALGAEDDLILARVARSLASLIRDRRFLRVPDLVDVWIDARDREQMWRRMSQTMRRTIRALLAGGYSWSEAHDPAAFERFPPLSGHALNDSVAENALLMNFFDNRLRRAQSGCGLRSAQGDQHRRGCIENAGPRTAGGCAE